MPNLYMAFLVINELESTVTAFRYDADRGVLTSLQTISTDNIVVFRIDPKTGVLRPTGQSLAISMPVCIKMMPCDR